MNSCNNNFRKKILEPGIIGAWNLPARSVQVGLKFGACNLKS